MYNIHVTENGVLKLLSNLNIHKDAGPDEIPTGLLTELAPCLLKPSQHFSKHRSIKALYQLIGKKSLLYQSSRKEIHPVSPNIAQIN
jgi:hypothetical protein